MRKTGQKDTDHSSQVNYFAQMIHRKKLYKVHYILLHFFIMYGSGRGVSEKVSVVGFCLGSGLCGSCNSD